MDKKIYKDIGEILSNYIFVDKTKNEIKSVKEKVEKYLMKNTNLDFTIKTEIIDVFGEDRLSIDIYLDGDIHLNYCVGGNKMAEKELEVAIREVTEKMRNLGEDEWMDTGEIESVLGRTLAFIDYCKFTFGEDITDSNISYRGEKNVKP